MHSRDARVKGPRRMGPQETGKQQEQHSSSSRLHDTLCGIWCHGLLVQLGADLHSELELQDSEMWFTGPLSAQDGVICTDYLAIGIGIGSGSRLHDTSSMEFQDRLLAMMKQLNCRCCTRLKLTFGNS